MLEVLVERNGIVRAGIDAKLAEYARTEVVFVLRQYLLFHAVFDRSKLVLTLNHPGSHVEEKKKPAAPQPEAAK